MLVVVRSSQQVDSALSNAEYVIAQAQLWFCLHQVEGQLAAFAEQISASAPQAAAACRQVLAGDGIAAPSTATHSIQLTARRSYRLPEHSMEGVKHR